jgi:lipoyl(octanoyl) transferase
MAVDAALVESVHAGAPPALRFYRWAPACLSLGRNQPAAGAYDLRTLRERGWDVVRRPTGGRAVLHDRELTYSVIVPEGLLGGPRAAYALISRALVRGLRTLGADAALQPRHGRAASPPSLEACFREAAEGEVVVGGRKLVGSAQRREDGVILQHGSLLLESDQSEVAALVTAAGGSAPDASAATLREALGTLPSWDELVGALAAAWADEVGRAAEPSALSAAERARATELEVAFLDPAWTWRR